VLPVPIQIDNMARLKYIVNTTLLHHRETEQAKAGRAGVEVQRVESPASEASATEKELGRDAEAEGDSESPVGRPCILRSAVFRARFSRRLPKQEVCAQFHRGVYTDRLRSYEQGQSRD
jgi:hypothetical protein